LLVQKCSRDREGDPGCIPKKYLLAQKCNPNLASILKKHLLLQKCSRDREGDPGCIPKKYLLDQKCDPDLRSIPKSTCWSRSAAATAWSASKGDTGTRNTW
jgi:hypothetical protein